MTFRSPIFRKLLGSAFVLIVVTLFVLDLYLARYIRAHQIENVEQRLLLEARILAGELQNAAPPDLERWAHSAEHRADARITLIDAQGAVLADSQQDPETMENHASRPEVRRAAQGEAGTAVRRSATLNRDLAYVAVPLGPAGRPGQVLRLAVPLEEIDASIAAVRRGVLAASAVAALFALAVAYLFSRRVTRRIGRLQDFAEGLAEARFSETIAPDGRDELGSLARSLDRMGARLRDLVGKLSLESARRESILASMMEGVLAVDDDLRVTFCNQSFAHAAGAPYPIREGTPVLELVRDPGLIEFLNNALASGESVKQRLELRAGRVFEAQVAPLAAPGHRGAIAILHDTTELERLERVRKDFVANVSHELRTPLAAILGSAETLLDGALQDPANNRRFVGMIKAHAERITSIASDLLVLSELESGRSAVDTEAISVRAAVDGALSAVESEARFRNVTLVRGELIDAAVAGDRMRFEQALVNLLANAVKFNKPRGEVRVQVTRLPDGKVQITVADTGIGIASADIPRIFERFYRADKARSREVGGTGLGLSIVKHTVDRMGGTVTVESELGKGSTFAVVLPAIK